MRKKTQNQRKQYDVENKRHDTHSYSNEFNSNKFFNTQSHWPKVYADANDTKKIG